MSILHSFNITPFFSISKKFLHYFYANGPTLSLPPLGSGKPLSPPLCANGKDTYGSIQAYNKTRPEIND